jgi:hypothetical protein
MRAVGVGTLVVGVALFSLQFVVRYLRRRKWRNRAA